MFVGTTGIDRVVERTVQIMVEHDTDDAGPHGAIPLSTLQKYINFHYTVSLDLFGGEQSTNVANYFTAGIKGRWMEERRKDDHTLLDDSAMVDAVQDGQVSQIEIPALLGLNQDLRGEYVADCENGLTRWNSILERSGLPQRLVLPHRAFNRKVGVFAGLHATPDGTVVTGEEWDAQQGKWLPTAEDKTYVRSLMRPVYERGKIASWIAPPRNGINGKPFDYDYVHLV
jgi:benzoyl-CoA 2,3-dioxygenase component B